MRVKPIQLGRLTAKEYKLIASEAKLSLRTVQKWFDNALEVRPSTEEKIIAAWLKVSSKSSLGIDKQIHDNNVVISKLESMNNELFKQKEIIQNRLDLIAKL